MDFVTGIIVGYTILRGLVKITIDDEGTRKSFTYRRGTFGRRELDSYKNRKVDLEFEWGSEEHPKLLRISFPTPTIEL